MTVGEQLMLLIIDFMSASVAGADVGKNNGHKNGSGSKRCDEEGSRRQSDFSNIKCILIC